jgi:CheY-like chemotaxis protein
MRPRIIRQAGTEGQVGGTLFFSAKGLGLKVLICSDSEIVLQLTGMALESAGHQVVLERNAHALVPDAPGAAALLVDAALGRQAAALLRDRGFAGRVLLVGETKPEELAQTAQELKLDGYVANPWEEDFPKRFAAAVESSRRVLIVDDSEIVARLLQEELEAKGFQIQYAPDVEKATSIILKRSTRPDLILLDINMPKVDGAQFCRFVKKNAMFRSIKVLFCSGDSKERMEKLVAECGADGYISKGELLGKWIVDNAG